MFDVLVASCHGGPHALTAGFGERYIGQPGVGQIAVAFDPAVALQRFQLTREGRRVDAQRTRHHLLREFAIRIEQHYNAPARHRHADMCLEPGYQCAVTPPDLLHETKMMGLDHDDSERPVLRGSVSVMAFAMAGVGRLRSKLTGAS